MKHFLILVGLLAGTSVFAQDGVLNPEELSVNRVMDNVEHGRLDMMTCASGYFITKAGQHVKARALFEACAEAGYTGAMTWMAQLDANGYGDVYSPESMAQWDLMAAQGSDPNGLFNYGLDLLRGHGVLQDEERGMAFIDRAAELGLAIAKTLQQAEYDLDVVTPDADNWKYQPLLN